MGKLRILKGQPTGDRWIKMRDISDTVEEWLVRYYAIHRKNNRRIWSTK